MKGICHDFEEVVCRRADLAVLRRLRHARRGRKQQTGTITGRAADASGGALPGVTVSITSPNMIGGARTAVTDEQGVYRFTLLPGGTYTVSFSSPASRR